MFVLCKIAELECYMRLYLHRFIEGRDKLCPSLSSLAFSVAPCYDRELTCQFSYFSRRNHSATFDIASNYVASDTIIGSTRTQRL